MTCLQLEYTTLASNVNPELAFLPAILLTQMMYIEISASKINIKERIEIERCGSFDVNSA